MIRQRTLIWTDLLFGSGEAAIESDRLAVRLQLVNEQGTHMGGHFLRAVKSVVRLFMDVHVQVVLAEPIIGWSVGVMLGKEQMNGACRTSVLVPQSCGG